MIPHISKLVLRIKILYNEKVIITHFSFQKAAAVFLLIAFFGISIFFTIQKSKNNSLNDASPTLSIASTLYPLQQFSEMIVGQSAHITLLISGTGEPHDFEPSPNDIQSIQSSDLFEFIGESFDPWATELSRDLPSRNVMNFSKILPLKQVEGVIDPHFWLNPKFAKLAVSAIAQSVTALDFTLADSIRSNEKIALSSLDHLDKLYSETLPLCARKEIFSSHAAFHYLSDYGLSSIALSGINPEVEPGPKAIALFITLMKERRAETIFVESFEDTELAETISQATDAEILRLDTLEHPPKDPSAGYDQIMKINLQTLQKGLLCPKKNDAQ